MLALLVCSWACAPPETPPAAPTPAPAREAPPPGRIQAEPILPRPVVVGAIHADAVEAGIAPHRPAIDACVASARAARPGASGKVLVKFLIERDGVVTQATTHATSLRDPTAEACINEQVRKATFPRLEEGRHAVVHYPFDFTAPGAEPPPGPATTPR